MAERIVFNYVKMQQTATKIRDIATRYKAASDTLVQDFTTAISGWEGESHDRMLQFIHTGVQGYTNDTIPQLLEALASLLEANAKQMQSADHQIAESIPVSQGK